MNNEVPGLLLKLRRDFTQFTDRPAAIWESESRFVQFCARVRRPKLGPKELPVEGEGKERD